MYLTLLIITYVYLILPEKKSINGGRRFLFSMITKSTGEIQHWMLGKKLLNGIELEKAVRQECVFGISTMEANKLIPYKHFLDQYQAISRVQKMTGSFGQENLKLFLNVLASDIQVERKLRQFMMENLLQMSAIGVITFVVLMVTLKFFDTSSAVNHLYIHVLTELLGGGIFFFLLQKYRDVTLGPIKKYYQTLQGLIILGTSGLSTQEVLSTCNYMSFCRRKDNDLELVNLHRRIRQCVEAWRDHGDDCEVELKSIHQRTQEHLDILNDKVMRFATILKMGVLSLFFLGSYLTNILILLQTYLGESFYTQAHY